MFNMMNATGLGFGFGLTILWGLHVLSVIAFFIGVLLLLFWAFKHLSEQQMKQWGWTLIIAGTVVCLFTIAAVGRPWGGYRMGGFGSTGMMPMMRNSWEKPADSAEQDKEVAEGKALYDKLKSKQAACTSLSDSDFELIGEYVMSEMAGARHGQMNTMMKQMMGEEGEEEMHVMMARRASGCFAQ